MVQCLRCYVHKIRGRYLDLLMVVVVFIRVGAGHIIPSVPYLLSPFPQCKCICTMIVLVYVHVITNLGLVKSGDA